MLSNNKFPVYSFIEDESKTGLLYWFYSTGTRFLKKLKNTKYRIKVLKGKPTPMDNNYLNVDYHSDIVAFSDRYKAGDWRTSFTKKKLKNSKSEMTSPLTGTKQN